MRGEGGGGVRGERGGEVRGDEGYEAVTYMHPPPSHFLYQFQQCQ